MKLTRLLTYAMAVGALMVAGSAHATMLFVGDAYYVGSVDLSTPANPEDEAGYLNTLIAQAAPSFTTIDGKDYDRSGNFAPAGTLGPVDTTSGNRQDTSDQDVNTAGQSYVIGKYATAMHVWYIEGFDDVTLPARTLDGGLLHSTTFVCADAPCGPNFDVPAPATLALLGLGMLGLGYSRRRRQS